MPSSDTPVPRREPNPKNKQLITSYDSGYEYSLEHLAEVQSLVQQADDFTNGYQSLATGKAA
jgi:hypothetical protein